jgi:hypothetical protein
MCHRVCWQMQSNHEVPVHEIVSSVNDMFYFFAATVSHIACLNVVQTLVVPQPRVSGCEATGIQQQGGARGHYAVQVCEYLRDKFSGRWRGRGSDTE